MSWSFPELIMIYVQEYLCQIFGERTLTCLNWG